MTDKALIDEFCRWVDNGKGDVWYQNITTKEWYTTYPTWDSTGHYITNDKHQELRRLQIDEPDTKFEFFGIKDRWVEAKPQWNIELEYRVKVEPVYEYQWVYYQTLMNTWRLTDKHYVKALSGAWTRLEMTKRIKNV